MNKIISLEKVSKLFKDDMTLMIGGFLGIGTPEILIDELIRKNVKNLTIIVNDTSFANKGVGRLIANKQIKKVITSHIGTNPESIRQVSENKMELELCPLGTLAERIRCGGNGLGGFLTPTGVGTQIEEGKQKIKINGKTYLLEMPLRADMALILGYQVDKKGNITYNKTARNFNPLIAMAADTVIVVAENLVEIGEIDPEQVITPGILVDYIVKGE